MKFENNKRHLKRILVCENCMNGHVKDFIKICLVVREKFGRQCSIMWWTLQFHHTLQALCKEYMRYKTTQTEPYRHCMNMKNEKGMH
jgi:hypothetical protein